jgi:hypothetical protein
MSMNGQELVRCQPEAEDLDQLASLSKPPLPAGVGLAEKHRKQKQGNRKMKTKTNRNQTNSSASAWLVALIGVGMAASIAEASPVAGQIIPLEAEASSNGGRGGGDSLSEHVRLTREAIGENGRTIRPVLIQMLDGLARSGIAGRSAELVQSIEKRGLRTDIKEAPYQLLGRCEEDGREVVTSTGTTHVDEAGATRPAICINMRMIAYNKLSLAYVAGSLMHSHARHFGLTDTVQGAYQPIGDLFAANYDNLLAFGKAAGIRKGLAALIVENPLRSKADRELYLLSTRAHPGKVSVRVIGANGPGCNDVRAAYHRPGQKDPSEFRSWERASQGEDLEIESEMIRFADVELADPTRNVLELYAVSTRRCQLKLAVKDGDSPLTEIPLILDFGKPGAHSYEVIYRTLGFETAN